MTTDQNIERTVQIVSAFVSNNPVPRTELPGVIGEVYRTLTGLTAPAAPEASEELVPAVPVRKSIAPEFIVCLEDGKKFKSLKRHLRTHYNLSPEQYRAKWGLPADYPMVAPSYSEKRSQLAKDNGLGRKPEPARRAAA
jgi:predicted transcriptional regulator